LFELTTEKITGANSNSPVGSTDGKSYFAGASGGAKSIEVIEKGVFVGDGV